MTIPTAKRRLLRSIAEELGTRRAEAGVVRATIGERLVAVELDGNCCPMGVAHRPNIGGDVTVPETARQLSRWAYEPPGDNPVAAALGLAALNARSVGAIDWTAGDPMAAVATDADSIATIGLFGAAFRKFDGVDVRVVEREPVEAIDAPPAVSVSVHGPEEAASAIADVDVLFITGSSLLYGGTLRNLQHAEDIPTVVMIGATASFLPEPVFAAGVDVLAGARVTDPAGVRSGIASGLCGTDLHDNGFEKVFVANRRRTPELDIGD